ncbi:TetR/AcrR family transcriptional regulator [Bailinhaonella thermotolerans]|uniref:TetR/AcrR family transcriptional regulator n=1 Tax=Bailinhaonella thermotolerans TaxID=1070861 RepID=A0A3A4AYW2_9ACTN|nr:TetR/AcrR family transcriptional regulator [Bailinhaonella thermotolerans]
MSAALQLFSTKDAESVSIDDVAALAGASRALVYHYFGGKQELYMAALHSAAEELQERLRPKAPGRPLDQLAAGLTRYFDFVEAHQAGFAALLRGGPSNRAGEVGETIENVRQSLFTMILENMSAPTSNPVLRTTLRSWIAAVETAGLDWLEHRDVERPRLEKMLVDYMIALLGVAANHDPEVHELFDRLIHDQFD